MTITDIYLIFIWSALLVVSLGIIVTLAIQQWHVDCERERRLHEWNELKQQHIKEYRR